MAKPKKGSKYPETAGFGAGKVPTVKWGNPAETGETAIPGGKGAKGRKPGAPLLKRGAQRKV